MTSNMPTDAAGMKEHVLCIEVAYAFCITRSCRAAQAALHMPRHMHSCRMSASSSAVCCSVRSDFLVSSSLSAVATSAMRCLAYLDCAGSRDSRASSPRSCRPASAAGVGPPRALAARRFDLRGGGRARRAAAAASASASPATPVAGSVSVSIPPPPLSPPWLSSSSWASTSCSVCRRAGSQLPHRRTLASPRAPSAPSSSPDMLQP
mmetsp:Transcript_23303/g.69210  ORF Transcript_23303/g.69210 Transcript_23303/m.69210 type:complete len:207 (+) Transcript_23303:1086-1706(+)